MVRISSTVLAIASLALAAPSAALGQLPPPAPPGPPVPAIGAPPPPVPGQFMTSLPPTTGTVARFTLAPRGELDGFILSDGTQVHVPPHLSAQLAAAVKPGDIVSVRGSRSPVVPLVVALSVTNTATGATVVDNGPPPPGFAPAPPPPAVLAPPTSITGRVQMPLYGPQGDVNGALLDDGTIIRLPPQEAYLATQLLRPGQLLTAQGWELTTAYGRVAEAQTVASAGNVPAPVAPPAPDVGAGMTQPLPPQPVR